MKKKLILYALGLVILLVVIFSGILRSPVYWIAVQIARVGEGVDSLVAEHMALVRSKQQLVLREKVLRGRIEALQLALVNNSLGSDSAGDNLKKLSVFKTPPSLEHDIVFASLPSNYRPEIGSRVYRIPSVMIGEVSGITGGYVTVTLISRLGIETHGRLPSGSDILLIGQGGGALSATVSGNMPIDTVQVGDIVFAASPEMPAIAEIVQVELEEHTGDLLVKARLLANPFLLPEIYVQENSTVN